MFGYVNVFKDELKIKDFNIYRAYYCGLCKQLGESFGAFYRLGLSYDFTFLALVLDSADDNKICFSSEGCAKHLGKKRLVVKNNSAINYAADMSVVLNYYKILDDINDEFFSKSHIFYLPYKSAMGKIKHIKSDIINSVRDNLELLYKLEKENCAEPDIVSDAFARAMMAIFSENRALENFGYNIGKFIYLIDALDDLEKDVKKKSYNPFYEKYGDNFEELINSAEFVLTFTLSKAAEEFEKLKIYKNYEIIKNIVYLGLRSKLDYILQKYKKSKDIEKEKCTNEKSV
ncbi:MAG: DUF5685 family protein [Oscillospiraceae bacterium]|nr:DUF5685 family protein [Oscillospiraceae bacterium]